MEEEAKDKEFTGPDSDPKKKYITIWRNKWITAKARDIDDLIEIKSDIRGDFIVISIKANGIGFTEEEKTRIFKQFGKIERYGQGMDIIAEGSGFGLFISKKIIKMHDGDIWVESEGRNKGSTFYILLPII